MLSELNSVNTALLSESQALNLNVVRTVYEMTAKGFDLPYGDVALLNSNWSYRNSPYAVAQNTGSFVEMPSFLDSSHSIKTSDDVDAYLSRMQAYAKQLDGETERVIADGERGAILPDFLMAKTIAQMQSALASPAEQWGLVDSLVVRGNKAVPNSGQNFKAQALSIATQNVRPAIERQVAALTSLMPKAKPDAGVWALPDGDQYYRWALQAGTTTTMSPDEVHQMGRNPGARVFRGDSNCARS